MYICSDTNVWIDFHEIGHLDHPFRLEFDYFISKHTFEEEFQKSRGIKSDLLQYGLKLADMSNEEFTEALEFKTRYPALSTYDAFALAIAKRRGWTLLTGDKPLRRAAENEKVECHGTIWVYDQLKSQEKLSAVEYEEAINHLIDAVNTGLCRLPMTELLKRKTL